MQFNQDSLKYTYTNGYTNTEPMHVTILYQTWSSHFPIAEMQIFLLQKYGKCSLSNPTLHVILTLFARRS